MTACSGDKHDLRFVYRQPDRVQIDVFYDDHDVPTVTEYRSTVLECRACCKTIYSAHTDQRTYTPNPVAINYSSDGIQYVYPTFDELTAAAR